MAEAPPAEPEPQAAAAGPPTSQAPSRDRAAQNPETGQEAPSPAQDVQTKAKRAEPPAAKAPAQEQAEVPEPARPRVTRGQLVDASTPGLAAPRLVSIEKPQYPPIARRMQVQGTVVVSVLVGETGAVEDVRLVQGVSQDVGLNEAALKAARSARFSPASVDDVPVKMWFNLRIPFQL
jgi:protein TonB